MPKLIVEAGKQIGSEFAVAERFTIGRLDTCEGVLDDDNISREHAAIRLVKGRYYLIDLQSRNGTLLNGKRIRRAPLAPGDRIAIGNTTLLFYDDEHDSRPIETLGSDEMKRVTDEAGAIEEERGPAEERAPRAPEAAPAAAAARAAAPAGADVRNDVLEAALFALLLVLTFLCASYATQIILRVLTA